MANCLEFDPRLTSLVNGQFRIWHDTFKCMIPRGMSTTRPLAPENIHIKSYTQQKINKSYFNQPCVWFLTTDVYTKYFDRFFLQTWRPADELPFDKPEIDYHEDMGLTRIITFCNPVFVCDSFAGGAYDAAFEFYYRDGTTWETREYTATINNDVTLELDFFLVVNPLDIHLAQGKVFDTGQFLQSVNLPISVILRRARIINGNSTMKVLSKNIVDFPVSLSSMTVKIVGGE